MPSTNPNLLPSSIVVALLIFIASMLLTSRICKTNLANSFLQRNVKRADQIVVVLGIFLAILTFLVNTGFMSQTSESNPPHGIEFGVWDENPDLEQFGGIAFVYRGEFLAIDLAESPANLKLISNERFSRYFLPPFARQNCFTNSTIGCTWADIDISHYGIELQWLEYLIRIGVAVLSGLIGCQIMWQQLKKPNKL